MQAQANNTPQVIKMVAEDRATWIVGNYRIHVLPGGKLVVTKADFFTGKQETYHEDICESHSEAMALAAEWVEIAIEDETEWVDE